MLKFLGKMLGIVFKGIGCLFMIIGFMVFVLVAAITYIVSEYVPADFMPKTAFMPDSYSLALNIDEIYDVRPDGDLITAISTAGIGISRRDVVKALKIAAKDDKIKGLYAKMNDNWLGLSDTAELRDSVQKFKQNGKNTEVYSEVLGLSGTGASSYYLASAFDKIWLQPTGDVNFAGVSLATPFFKGLLDKIGVQNEIYSLYEYKSGAESSTEDKMTPPVKENMTQLLDSVYKELIKETAAARKIPAEKMLNAVNNAPLTADDALKAGLIDKAGYFDDFIKDKGEIVSIKKYIADLKSRNKWNEDACVMKNAVKYCSYNKVAVIDITGMIISGSQLSPFFPENIAAADDIANALREAAKDGTVKAVVLNVNSGGGSYTASDVIRNAVEEIKMSRKIPVVAFLRSTAASGAYFVASSADWIIATPFTVTGSIGVFGGKPVINGLMQKLGVNVEIISRGDNAAMMSVTEPFTEKQKQDFKKSLERVYADFTEKVAKARGFDKQQIDKVARGRVFSGVQAAENGLIDETGSWDTVMDYVSENTKIAKEDLTLTVFPKPKTNMDLLMEFLDSADLSSPMVMFSAFSRQISVMNNSSLVYDAEYNLK